jgi:hypothetical protein
MNPDRRLAYEDIESYRKKEHDQACGNFQAHKRLSTFFHASVTVSPVIKASTTIVAASGQWTTKQSWQDQSPLLSTRPFVLSSMHG